MTTGRAFFNFKIHLQAGVERTKIVPDPQLPVQSVEEIRAKQLGAVAAVRHKPRRQVAATLKTLVRLNSGSGLRESCTKANPSVEPLEHRISFEEVLKHA